MSACQEGFRYVLIRSQSRVHKAFDNGFSHPPLDDSRVNRINSNTITKVRTFNGRGFGQEANAALSGTIRTQPKRTDDTGQRRDIYDAAAVPATTARFHYSNRPLCAEERSFQIHLLNALELLNGEILEKRKSFYPGVVHYEVQTTVCLNGELDNSLPVRLAHYIMFDELRPLNSSCSRSAQVLQDIRHDYPCALARQSGRDFRTKTLCGTRYQRHLAI